LLREFCILQEEKCLPNDKRAAATSVTLFVFQVTIERGLFHSMKKAANAALAIA
jgi:hypothetical protein